MQPVKSNFGVSVDVTQLHDQNAYLIARLSTGWGNASSGSWKFYTPEGEVTTFTGNFNQSMTVPIGTVCKFHSIQNEISHYECITTNEKISAKEYNDTVIELSKFQNEYQEWESIDAEYAYKKFKAKWSPVLKEVEKVYDVGFNVVNHVKFKTNNPYIHPVFTLSKSEKETLYTYERRKAYFDIIKKVFNELEVEFVPNMSWSKTNNKKIWSVGDQTNISSVVAFGSYLYTTEEMNRIKDRVGTLEDMLNLYKNDKRDITTKIKYKYALHFLSVESDKILVTEMCDFVSDAITSLEKIESTSKTYKTKESLIGKMNKFQNKLFHVLEKHAK